MNFRILVPKETRAEETRVGLIPKDVSALIAQGHTVFVEYQAGIAAGYSNQDYEKAGAHIRYLTGESLAHYQNFFEGIDVVLRVKRPARDREILENLSLSSRTILIGALDPLENDSAHIHEYLKAGIIAYSIDQLDLAPNHPMNVLHAMSEIAGRLAFQNALDQFCGIPKRMVVIGYGTAGRSALDEALRTGIESWVVFTRSNSVDDLKARGATPILLPKNYSLFHQQRKIAQVVRYADIVITAARKPYQKAPVLIPLHTLRIMKPGTVVIDLALSEGGNVEGSLSDKTLILGNGVWVTNNSGYPKKLPNEASQRWSGANVHFIESLAKGDDTHQLCCIHEKKE